MGETDELRLALARLLVAVLLTLAVLSGCFVLLIGAPNDRTQTSAMEISTVIVTAWVAYFAAVTSRRV